MHPRILSTFLTSASLGTICQDLLVNYIIKESSHSEYSETMREMETPEWSRIQNPVKHFNSCSYNQLGQLAQMNPFALRIMLQDHMIKEFAYANIAIIFREEMHEFKWSRSDVIVHIYTLFARAQYYAMLRQVSKQSRQELEKALMEFHRW